MLQCCVPECTSKSGAPNIVVYGLPSVENVVRRKEWLDVIGVDGKTIDEHSGICSRHFMLGTPGPGFPLLGLDCSPSNNIPIKVEKWMGAKDTSKLKKFIILRPADPLLSLETIISNVPYINDQFDIPDYVLVDKQTFNEREIESTLVNNYITSAVCEKNGYYINDHDYLGLPIIREKTGKIANASRNEENHQVDHDYQLKEEPPCLYTDLSHFCNICRSNNSNLFSFNMHMMSHTRSNHIMCNICSQVFLTTTCLNNHLTVHTTVCDVCGIEVPIVQLRAHQEANKLRKEEFQVPRYLKSYICVDCSKVFRSRRELLGHNCCTVNYDRVIV